MEEGAKLGRDARPWSRMMRGQAVFAVVFALCAGMAWASAAYGAKTSAADEQSVKASAENGDAAAQFRYAEMLRDGRGVKKDVREAVVWTRKAAETGHVAAQC